MTVYEYRKKHPNCKYCLHYIPPFNICNANEMRDKLFELLTDCETEYAQYLSEECDKAIKGDVTKQLFKRLEFYADRLIENGVVVPQWTSVKDRLPETNGKYLCAEYSKTFKKQYLNVSRFATDLYKVDKHDFCDEKGKSGFYGYSSEWGYFKESDITHWMPLPEPPKAEQKLKEMRGGNESI